MLLVLHFLSTLSKQRLWNIWNCEKTDVTRWIVFCLDITETVDWGIKNPYLLEAWKLPHIPKFYNFSILSELYELTPINTKINNEEQHFFKLWSLTSGSSIVVSVQFKMSKRSGKPIFVFHTMSNVSTAKQHVMAEMEWYTPRWEISFKCAAEQFSLNHKNNNY